MAQVRRRHAAAGHAGRVVHAPRVGGAREPRRDGAVRAGAAAGAAGRAAGPAALRRARAAAPPARAALLCQYTLLSIACRYRYLTRPECTPIAEGSNSTWNSTLFNLLIVVWNRSVFCICFIYNFKVSCDTEILFIVHSLRYGRFNRATVSRAEFRQSLIKGADCGKQYAICDC